MGPACGLFAICSPSWIASMLLARAPQRPQCLRPNSRRKTTMSSARRAVTHRPTTEVCALPPTSGVDHAVMSPSPFPPHRPIPASTMLPPLTPRPWALKRYITRIPPPPVCACTEPRTSPKSICSASSSYGYKIPRLANGDISAFCRELRFPPIPGANVPPPECRFAFTANEASY